MKPISVTSNDAKMLKIILQIPPENRTRDQLMKMKDYLRKVRFFTQFNSQEQFTEMLRGLEIESFQPDSVIFRQGDEADKFYIVLSGMIGLYIRTERKEQVPEFVHRSGNSREKQERVNGVREIARLQSGESFGELGLLSNEARTASAVCMESTSLLTLKKDVFDKYLSQQSRLVAKIYSIFQFYSSLWFFRDVPSKQIQQLATKTSFNECPSNTLIIAATETPKGVFFVKHGNVKIVAQIIASNSIGEDVLVDELGNGDFFAVIEALNNIPVSFSAVSVTPCDILTVTIFDLKETIPENVFLRYFVEKAYLYPTVEKIAEQFEDNKVWDKFKYELFFQLNSEFVNETRKRKMNDHRQPFINHIKKVTYQVSEQNIRGIQDDQGDIELENVDSQRKIKSKSSARIKNTITNEYLTTSTSNLLLIRPRELHRTANQSGNSQAKFQLLNNSFDIPFLQPIDVKPLSVSQVVDNNKKYSRPITSIEKQNIRSKTKSSSPGKISNASNINLIDPFLIERLQGPNIQFNKQKDIQVTGNQQTSVTKKPSTNNDQNNCYRKSKNNGPGPNFLESNQDNNYYMQSKSDKNLHNQVKSFKYIFPVINKKTQQNILVKEIL